MSFLAIFGAMKTAEFWIKAAPWILAAAAIAAVYIVWGWKEEAQAKQALAEQHLQIALDVNADNLKANEERERWLAEERRVTAAAIAAANKRATRTTSIKKELRNAPGATDLAGPYFDDLGDRLRAGSGDSADGKQPGL